MSNVKTKGYEQEVLPQDNRNKYGVELIKKAGEHTKPYGSHILGSFSFHIYAKFNPMTGTGDVGLVTLATEMDAKPEILGRLLEPIRDTILKIFGGDLKNIRPRTEAEVEQDVANQAMAKEQGLIQ